MRPVADVVAQLVGREVAASEPRAGFEADHLEARLRERQHRHAAGGAEADDDDVGGRGWSLSNWVCFVAVLRTRTWASEQARDPSAGRWPSP